MKMSWRRTAGIDELFECLTPFVASTVSPEKRRHDWGRAVVTGDAFLDVLVMIYDTVDERTAL